MVEIVEIVLQFRYRYQKYTNIQYTYIYNTVSNFRKLPGNPITRGPVEDAIRKASNFCTVALFLVSEQTDGL